MSKASGMSVYEACKDLPEMNISRPSRFRAYRLKHGTKIHVDAS